MFKPALIKNIICAAILLFSAVSSSYAVLMQTTMTGFLHTSSPSALASSIWDLGILLPPPPISMTVIYDDASTFLTTWDDGSNGIAEFGSGDDQDLIPPDILNISDPGAASLYFMADAAYTFDDNTNLFKSSAVDNSSSHWAWYYINFDYRGYLYLNYYYRADGFLANIVFPTTSGELPQGGIRITNPDTGAIENISIFNATYETIPAVIPIPATIWLLGSGFAVLLIGIRRKQK